VLLALGLVLSFNKRMGLANPFQVYFGLWLVVVSWFFVTADTYPALFPEFKLLMLGATGLSFALLLCIKKYSQFDSGRYIRFDTQTRNSLLYLSQVMVVVSVPFAYQNAVALAGNADVFTKAGYAALRSALLVQKGHSVFGYLCTLSMLLTAILAYQFKWSDRLATKALTFLSFGTTGFYLLLSTGRTFALLFFCLLLVPLILAGRLKLRGVVTAAALVLISFAVVTILLGKLSAVQGGDVSVVSAVYQHLKDYMVDPFVSFSELFKQGSPMLLGEYTFRFFVSILRALHLTELVPVPMVREYPAVPNLVNVYTVYEVYFLDFAYWGFLFPTGLLFVNWALYVRAKKLAGPWLFIYGASFFPLLMQFFNDQYMTLLSMWIQIAFFSFVFVKSSALKPNQ